MEYSLDDLRQRLVLLDRHVDAARERHHDAQIAVQQAAADLEAAQLRRSGAAAFIAELDADEAKSDRITDGMLGNAAKPPARGFRHSVGNADIIGAIIAEHPQGIHLKDILRIVSERGHGFDSEQVRSAVSYLGRRGDVENIRRGVWRVTTPNGGANPNGSTEVRPFELASPPSTAEVKAG